jgi:hypothetical protein
MVCRLCRTMNFGLFQRKMMFDRNFGANRVVSWKRTGRSHCRIFIVSRSRVSCLRLNLFVSNSMSLHRCRSFLSQFAPSPCFGLIAHRARCFSRTSTTFEGAFTILAVHSATIPTTMGLSLPTSYSVSAARTHRQDGFWSSHRSSFQTSPHYSTCYSARHPLALSSSPRIGNAVLIQRGVTIGSPSAPSGSATPKENSDSTRFIQFDRTPNIRIGGSPASASFHTPNNRSPASPRPGTM